MNLIHLALRKFGSLCLKIGHALIRMAYRIYQPPQSTSEKNKKEWYEINGDANLRLEYDLNESSVVFDIGGFIGDWCAEISARYSSNIFVFEPVNEFYSQLTRRFSKNSKIKIFQFGLSSSDVQLEMSVMSEASSAFRTKNLVHTTSYKETVKLKSIIGFITANAIQHIDLMKINIEGGEYELLETLISSGVIKQIDNIQIQFHDFITDAESKMKYLKLKLSETHELTYEYVFVWENWRRKK